MNTTIPLLIQIGNQAQSIGSNAIAYIAWAVAIDSYFENPDGIGLCWMTTDSFGDSLIQVDHDLACIRVHASGDMLCIPSKLLQAKLAITFLKQCFSKDSCNVLYLQDSNSPTIPHRCETDDLIPKLLSLTPMSKGRLNKPWTQFLNLEQLDSSQYQELNAVCKKIELFPLTAAD